MQISKVMTTNVHACHPQNSLGAAARLMWDGDCGCLPVVDDGNKVSGIITDRDVCMAAYIQGKPLDGIPVESVMSRQVTCCRPDDDLIEAERLMRERQIRRLPVIDREDRLVGLLALNDVALAAATGSGKARGLKADDVAKTLAAICAPRPRPAAA